MAYNTPFKFIMFLASLCVCGWVVILVVLFSIYTVVYNVWSAAAAAPNQLTRPLCNRRNKHMIVGFCCYFVS